LFVKHKNIKRKEITMLNTSFAGKIDLIGSGRFQSNWFIKRSVIKMGSRKLRQVVVSDALDDFLDASVKNESNVQMAVGWVMFYRWLLAIQYQGETLRQGIILFVVGMFTHAFITFIGGWLLGALIYNTVSPTLGAIAGFGIAGYCLITTILNIKAWVAPGFK
jgi:hypothetical protein